MIKKFIFLFVTISFVSACYNSEDTKPDSSPSLTDARIKLYTDKISADPSNYLNYDKLAENYIQRARETGNTTYYNEAEKALIKSQVIKPENYVALLLLSKTMLANHRFEDALTYAKRAVDLRPQGTAVYGILGDAYLELGQSTNAERSYKKMLALKPDLDSYSRMSNLMHHKHSHGEAIKYMELAYESGIDNPSTPKENLAWTQVMIGSIHLHSGRVSEAEAHFERALEIFEGYYLAHEHMEKINSFK